MSHAPGPMTSADLLPRGPLRRVGGRVLLYDTVESTNALLLGRANELADGTVAHAECQTAGRGRQGRRWEAPRGSSILLSVLLLEPPGSLLQSRAALLGALAACEAIECVTDVHPALRWPNDIFARGRKLGGVLAESCGLADGVRGVVIGVGLNCLQHRGHFAGELRERATSLDCESAGPVQRGPVATALLARLDDWLARMRDDPGAWSRLLAAWRQHCEDVGARITLQSDGRAHTGTALDITDEGDLILQLDEGGRRHFGAATTTRIW